MHSTCGCVAAIVLKQGTNGMVCGCCRVLCWKWKAEGGGLCYVYAAAPKPVSFRHTTLSDMKFWEGT